MFIIFQYSLYSQKHNIDSLYWLTGSWQSADKQSITTEQWMMPSGNTMLGMSRTVSEGKTVLYEFLRIVQDQDGNISYIAIPSGQKETSFKLKYIRDKEAAFENPKHDFPQRITYKLINDKELYARIEGEVDGKTESAEFVMKKIICE